MVRIEQLMAEAESLTVEAPDYEVAQRAAELLAEHRRMLVDVKQKLGESGD